MSASTIIAMLIGFGLICALGWYLSTLPKADEEDKNLAKRKNRHTLFSTVLI